MSPKFVIELLLGLVLCYLSKEIQYCSLTNAWAKTRRYEIVSKPAKCLLPHSSQISDNTNTSLRATRTEKRQPPERDSVDCEDRGEVMEDVICQVYFRSQGLRHKCFPTISITTPSTGIYQTSTIIPCNCHALPRSIHPRNLIHISNPRTTSAIPYPV